MLDDLDHLRENSSLLELLGHYAETGEENREAWQDRLMQLEGRAPRELTKLHGQLLGFGWIEQNTGHTPVLRPGSAAACYRVTHSGLKAFREVQGIRQELSAAEAIPNFGRRFPRKKRKKNKERQPAAGGTP